MKPVNARVLLTGASGGIGQAASARLVEAGASVMLVGRSAAGLSDQAKALKRRRIAANSQVDWHAADLTHPASVAELAEVAAEWDCNVVVHGAGVPGFGRLEAHDASDVVQLLHINLLVPILLSQAMLPRLRLLPEARILFVGSVLGRVGLPGYSVYSASKFALRGFAEALRRELGGTSVGVQYLGPRSTRTAFNSPEVTRYNDATGTATDDPQVAGTALLELLESGAAERFLGYPERLAGRINGLAPTWLDGVFAKHRASLPALASPLIPSSGSSASVSENQTASDSATDAAS